MIAIKRKRRKVQLSPTQQRLLALMKDGHTLMWYGNHGPELNSTPAWPQKVTVRKLIKIGALKWGEYNNDSQRQAGICPVILNPEFSLA